MADLPLELLHVIAKDVQHDPSIFNLRLVSKTLNSVAAPLAFRIVTVSDSLKSAEAVSFLQGCDESITSLVREVVFRGDPENTVEPSALESEAIDEIAKEAARREALRIVFSGLTNFRNFQTLRLHLHDSHDEWANGGPTHYFLLQIGIFAALAANPPPPLVSLTLKNVIALSHDIYAQERLHRVFRSLQELDIDAISDMEVDGGHYDGVLEKFWDQSVAHMVRSSTAVTALTIRSDRLVGANLELLSFKDILLPHLSSLVLHRFALQPDVLGLVLRHKATLTRLELHDCSIDGSSDREFPYSWHTILASFEAELGALHDFVFKNDLDGIWTPGNSKYFEYTRESALGYAYWQEDTEAVGKGLDVPALEALMATVKSRRLDENHPR